MRFAYKISYLKINNKVIGALKTIQKDILVYIYCYIYGFTTEEGIWYARRGDAMKQIHLFSAVQKQSRAQI